MANKRKRRNRKKRVDGYVVPKSYHGLIVFVAVAAFSFLWLDSRCEKLGRDIMKLEKEQVQLENKFLNEEYKWMSMKSPKHLEDTLLHYGITMTWPRRNQVVWLADAQIQVDMNLDDIRESNPRMAAVRRVARYD